MEALIAANPEDKVDMFKQLWSSASTYYSQCLETRMITRGKRSFLGVCLSLQKGREHTFVMLRRLCGCTLGAWAKPCVEVSGKIFETQKL